ncbi:unnamed protein product [Thelazia callipaeda]|uniref:C6 domain-containing protein n=1 Tax=Thelazia callipaeda TaxID=103827 RepID=A0A0N5D3M1_THECL|nr:unnamed protein product [Thelazia callipaeda]
MITFLLVTTQLPATYSCAATPPVVLPAPAANEFSITINLLKQYNKMIVSVCCQPLIKTLTNNTNLENGVMTFTYNSLTCRRTATAICTQRAAVPPLQLMAGITVNQVNFINIQQTSVSITLSCNNMMQWETGNPPLVVSTIQCVLSSTP